MKIVKSMILFIMLILSAIIMSISIYASNIIGYVSHTDITAYIDESAIESYNYNGYTYIIVEELTNYGFNVEWNAYDRTLKITRDKYVFKHHIPEYINKLNDDPSSEAFVIYKTDIKTYINDAEVQSYNINGKTIINIESLDVFGYCTYDDTERIFKLDILLKEIENLEERDTHYEDGDYYHTTYSKGIFEDDELIYGIYKSENPIYYGIYKKYEIGNFKDNNYISIEDDYRNFYIFYKFIDNDNYWDCRTKTVDGDYSEEFIFKFKYYLQYKMYNGYEYNYLDKNGELYFVMYNDRYYDVENNEYYDYIEGALYKDGELIHEGKIYLETIHTETTIQIMVAKGYNDKNGVVYQYDFSRTSDYVYYRGNVKDGLPDGKGATYYKGDYYHCDKYYYYSLDGMEIRYPITGNIMYQGTFKEGYYDGYGVMYNIYGIPQSEGTWIYGVRNGDFNEYMLQDIDYDGTPCIFLHRDVTYVNGRVNGDALIYWSKGHIIIGGIYLSYEGEYVDDFYTNGTHYTTYYDAENNINVPYLYCISTYDEDTKTILSVIYDKDGNKRLEEESINPWEMIYDV